jgi:hypothetical protein
MAKIELKNFTGKDGFRNWGFRIVFPNQKTGWHKGFHSSLDAEYMARKYYPDAPKPASLISQ